MFSVRRATNHPEYVYKTRRITLFRRTKRITLRRDEILLLRLVIDSRILVDLVTDPKSTFAVKLKAKCADLHTEQFSWLLDPTAVSIDGALDERTPSVLSISTTSGHWVQIEWLMQQCLRPCAAIMKPSLSAAYEVVKSYLLPHADLVQQPEFFARVPLAHESRLPTYVVCNTYLWWNFDQLPKATCFQASKPDDGGTGIKLVTGSRMVSSLS